MIADWAEDLDPSARRRVGFAGRVAACPRGRSNRMSSGRYFPSAVKAVRIPKPHGSGVRVLGVPTVADRIAQTVVARRLESKVEPTFHPDSYGYPAEPVCAGRGGGMPAAVLEV